MPHPIHIIKSNYATYVHLPQLNKTASTINTLQVHAKGNKLNHNDYCHARYTLEITRQLSYMLNLNRCH